MTGPARIAAFGAVLAAAFVAAVGVGAVAGPLREPRVAEPQHGMAEAAPMGPAGLAVAENGYRLEVATASLRTGRPRQLAVRIVDARGVPLRAYDVSHEKRLHLIVVRRDLTGFQHLHPRLGADGTWRVAAAPFAPGSYRVFADFVTGGEKTVLGGDLDVAGAWTRAALPPSHRSADVDGYVVSLDPGSAVVGEQTLAFRVTRGGRAVATQPYLGAGGHLVVLREGDLGYLHAHAAEDSLQFDTEFPTAGRYRAFLQFRAGGAVHTAAFTVEAR